VLQFPRKRTLRLDVIYSKNLNGLHEYTVQKFGFFHEVVIRIEDVLPLKNSRPLPRLVVSDSSLQKINKQLVRGCLEIDVTRITNVFIVQPNPNREAEGGDFRFLGQVFENNSLTVEKRLAF
jgi:hypothetical protein